MNDLELLEFFKSKDVQPHEAVETMCNALASIIHARNEEWVMASLDYHYSHVCNKIKEFLYYIQINDNEE